jgi:hypothetical protein
MQKDERFCCQNKSSDRGQEMNTYWLSFRIQNKDVNGKSYGDRYNNFVETLRGLRAGYWEETTAFMIFQSDYKIDEIAAAAKKAFAPSADLFVIRALDSKTARACGNIADNDLFALMPYATNI